MNTIETMQSWVKDMSNITIEEYQAAFHIMERFKYQQDKTVQATVRYDAEVCVTVKVPNDWDGKTVIKELKDGYYHFDKEEIEDVRLIKLTEVILNGEEVNLKTGKIKKWKI